MAQVQFQHQKHCFGIIEVIKHDSKYTVITQDLTSSFSSMSGNELVPFCDRTYNNRL